LAYSSFPEHVYEFHSLLDRKLYTFLLSLCSGPIATCTMQIAPINNINASNKGAFSLFCLPQYQGEREEFVNHLMSTFSNVSARLPLCHVTFAVPPSRAALASFKKRASATGWPLQFLHDTDE